MILNSVKRVSSAFGASGIAADFRFALRSLAHNPVFAIAVVLILAIGIGMSAHVVGFAHAEFFKDLPYDRHGRVLYMMATNTLQGDAVAMVSYPDFRDWQAKSKSFQDMAAYAPMQSNISDDTGLPDNYRSAAVTANVFKILKQPPLVGRDFSELDEKPGAEPVVMLSHSLWRERYGGAALIVGKTIRVNRAPVKVIGVMPPNWVFPNDAQLWLAISQSQITEQRATRNLVVYGPLADQATLQSARAEMEEISRDLSAAYPQTNQGIKTSMLTFRQLFVGKLATYRISSMLICVFFVVLITCANVASLVLARGMGRAHEISLRFALGAGRGRVMRLLVTESLILTALGSLMAWLFAYLTLGWFDRVATATGKPLWIDFSLDVYVTLYLTAAAVGTGLFFAVVPAILLWRPDMRQMLNAGRTTSFSDRPVAPRFRTLLPIIQTALVVVLLVGTGLMLHGYLNVATSSLGVDPGNVLTMKIVLPRSQYPDREAQLHLYEQVKSRFAAIPGVESVTAASSVPTMGSLRFFYRVEDQPATDRPATNADRRPNVNAVLIDSDYFRVWRVNISSGRNFTDADGAAATPVGVVNQAFARRVWGAADCVGKRIELFTTQGQPLQVTVVGVVSDIVQNDVSAAKVVDELIYLPLRQYDLDGASVTGNVGDGSATNFLFRVQRMDGINFMARTSVDPDTLKTAFRQQLYKVDPEMPLVNPRSMRERRFRNHFPQQTVAVTLTVFSIFALILSGIGIYATVAQSVRKRIPEIGVRVALGATRRNITLMVLAESMRGIVIGVIIGLAVAWPVGRLLSALNYEITPDDPVALFGAPLFLLIAGVLGSLIPTYRATNVDPMVALRYQ